MRAGDEQAGDARLLRTQPVSGGGGEWSQGIELCYEFWRDQTLGVVSSREARNQ